MKETTYQELELDMSIRRFVTRKLIGVEQETSIKNSVAKMVEFNISSMVVMSDDEVVGFFTDSDIKARVVAAGVSADSPVKEIMTTDLVTADVNTSVREALNLMASQKIKHILVTESDTIVGLITLRDLEDMERQKLETYISRE